MTDADKVLALTELLGDVMLTLELKQYLIEDPTESYECEFQANQFHQQMIEILYPDSQCTILYDIHCFLQTKSIDVFIQ